MNTRWLDEHLVPLVCRSGVPAVALSRARLLRKEIMRSLLSETAESPLDQQALVVACNLHAETRWWTEHSKDASLLLQQTAAVLCRVQQQAIASSRDV